MFDRAYVLLLTEKLEPLEEQYQQIAAERNYVLKLLAEHTGMIGLVPEKISEDEAAILWGFINLLKQAQPTRPPVIPHKAISTVSIPGRCYTFGGIRDD